LNFFYCKTRFLLVVSVRFRAFRRDSQVLFESRNLNTKKNINVALEIVRVRETKF
jgi:hypothetical protein